MSHPSELLSEYVDGTLAERERARVDAHLATCQTCREEVALARAAVPALASLPEAPVPLGVTGRVVEVARTDAWSAGRPDQRSPRWARATWALAGTAAASLVVVLAIALSGGPAQRAATGGVAETAGAASAPAIKDAVGGVGLQRQARDYDDASVHELASSVAAKDRVALGSLQSSTPRPAPSASTSTGVEGPAPANPSPAIRCLQKAGATFSEQDRLARLIQATFRGVPAYLGVFLEGPEGSAPDRVAVWAVASRDCQVLTLFSQRL
jgi:hypothetical protein